jgi:hypothetical protein
VRRKNKQKNKEHVVQRQIMKITKNIDQYRPAVYTKKHACGFVVIVLPYGYYTDDSCYVY